MAEKKRKIRASDNPDWVWDNEDVAKRFMATPYLNANYSKDMSDEDKAALKEDYKAYKKMSIDDLLKSKDFQPFYEYVEEDEEVEPNNYTSKSLWGDGEQNPYTGLDKLLDEWDKEEIKDNFTPPGAKSQKDEDKSDLLKAVEKVIKTSKPVEVNEYLTLEPREPKVEDVDTSAIDEKDSGKSEEDDLDLYMKDLDDYMSKNKKGRDDIPVTTRR